MRHLACAWSLFAAALAGCLAAPTGRQTDAGGDDDAGIDADVPEVWPPAGAHIIAVAGGALDGDAIDDVVAVDEMTKQVYLLRGDGDVHPGANLVTTYNRSAPIMDLHGPAAALILPATTVPAVRPAHLVVVDSPMGGTRVTVFNADLMKTGENVLAGVSPGPTDTVTVQHTTFGMDQSSVWFSTPTQVGFIERSFLVNPAPEIRRPGGNPVFASVAAIGGHTPPPTVFVSEPTKTQKASVAGMVWTWTTVRSTGTWTGQTVGDVTSDGNPDAVGFEYSPGPPVVVRRVCATDVEMMAPVATNCADYTAGMFDAATLALADVTGMGRTDLLMLDTDPPFPGAGLFVVTDVRATAASITLGAQAAPRDLQTFTGARMAVVQLDAGGREVIVVGEDGRAACSRWNGLKMDPCGP